MIIDDRQDGLKAQSPAEIEEWILGAVEAEPVPAERLVEAVARIAEADPERAAGAADLVVEAFTKERPARESTEFVKASGFKGDVPLAECLRRLNTLRSLAPGCFCHDKTWGFGVVRRVDAFYQKVHIDFTKKPAHQMSFAYAAEVLDLVGDDHLLARKHKDPAGLVTLVNDDPAEVVRIALRSYGPMPVAMLEELLVADVLGDTAWKKFWDAARKGLKADPLVDVPTRRSEPVRLLSSAKAYDDAWFAALRGEKDLVRVMRLVQEAEREVGVADLSPSQLEAVGSRLAFAAKGARGTDAMLFARVLMAAHRFGVPADMLDVGAELNRLKEPDEFVAAVSDLPARELAALLAQMAGYDREGTVDVAVSTVVRLPATALNEVVEFLERQGQEQRAAGPLGDALRSLSASGELLLWTCRRSDLRRAWNMTDAASVLGQTIDALEARRRDDRLRTLNQVRALFEDRAWLADILQDLGDEQRKTLFVRVGSSRGWDEAGRRSILARMIKLYPELEASAAEVGEATEPEGVGRVTSWRSYRQRQEQLRNLVEVLIPENSKEIGVARSYGDLSENFEYQAAKDQQKILMQRQREWESDLRQVRGTDFAGMPSEVAGTGTRVTVERPGGATDSYCILGEWDSDPALGIIPSGSRLAAILDGRKQGDEVGLPTETDGEEMCRITAVEGLPEEVKEWVRGE